MATSTDPVNQFTDNISKLIDEPHTLLPQLRTVATNGVMGLNPEKYPLRCSINEASKDLDNIVGLLRDLHVSKETPYGPIVDLKPAAKEELYGFGNKFLASLIDFMTSFIGWSRNNVEPAELNVIYFFVLAIASSSSFSLASVTQSLRHSYTDAVSFAN
jgi:hypothetical protein